MAFSPRPYGSAREQPGTEVHPGEPVATLCLAGMGTLSNLTNGSSVALYWVAAYLPFTNTSNRGKHEVYDRLLTGPSVDFQ